MKSKPGFANAMRSNAAVALFLIVGLAPFGKNEAYAQTDPLPAWNDGPAKQAILSFVRETTDPSSPKFVPPAPRIATFDSDGTLWAEQPMYFQFLFALDRVKALAPEHPEWKTKEPFASLLKGDVKGALSGGERAMLEMVMVTHAGMTTAEFEENGHRLAFDRTPPEIQRPYTEVVYQPMIELLQYLRANGFKTFIVSGGGIEFMRPWTEKVYGIPPEQVVGSSIKTKFELRNGSPVLVRLPEVNFIDDKTGKPIGIHEHIGRRPIAAFGNSVGDQQMLEWTQAGGGPSLMMLVHHDAFPLRSGIHSSLLRESSDDSCRIEPKKGRFAMNHWKVIGMRRTAYLVCVLLVPAFAQMAGTQPTMAWTEGDDDDACSSRGGPAVRLPATKFFIEHNSTDEDTGVHGLFDGVDWKKLCVLDPLGRRILEIEPERQLRKQSISGIFFESAEPPNEDVPIEEILRRFPEGRYSVRGRAGDGRRLTGAATFTHAIPAGPIVTFPEDGDVVPASNLVISWNHVTTTLDGEPLDRTGYEVIVTKEVPDDPHGFSRPVLSVHVPPSVTSLTIPDEFLEPGTTYELEVLVLEVSGNQTLSSLFFQTH
jgi:hypothetical protein